MSFEGVLTSEVYYMNLEYMKKAHLISDFRKENLLGWGSNSRK
jgi:hypothetical protein